MVHYIHWEVTMASTASKNPSIELCFFHQHASSSDCDGDKLGHISRYVDVLQVEQQVLKIAFSLYTRGMALWREVCNVCECFLYNNGIIKYWLWGLSWKTSSYKSPTFLKLCISYKFAFESRFPNHCLYSSGSVLQYSYTTVGEAHPYTSYVHSTSQWYISMLTIPCNPSPYNVTKSKQYKIKTSCIIQSSTKYKFQESPTVLQHHL